jgi:Holliday junction resolvasome RuvABC endonuclease subunit
MITGLSFDIAPTHSAYILWEDEEAVQVMSFKKPGCSIIEMIFWINLQIETHQMKRDLDWVAVEKSIYINNAKNTINLGKILGTMELNCYHSSICFLEGTTAEIDSACGIPHKDRKTYTRTLAETYFPQDRKLTEDECDAIAIGIWGWGKYKEYQFGLDS